VRWNPAGRDGGQTPPAVAGRRSPHHPRLPLLPPRPFSASSSSSSVAFAPSFSASSSSSSSGCQLVRQSGLPCELAGEAAVLIAASTNDALSRNQSAALCRRVSECGVVSSVPLSEPDSRRPLSCASLSVLLLLLRRRTRACSRGSLSSRLTRVQRLTKFRQECMANLNSRVIQFSLRMRARENQFHLTHSMNPPRLFTFVADEALT